jgi:hypothetical protein
MRLTTLAALAFVAVAAQAQSKPSPSWDVAAIEYTAPPSHPCNKPSGGKNGFTYAVCITGPETHWKCADSRRVMLESEDGVKHCILFPPQEPAAVSVASKEKK